MTDDTNENDRGTPPRFVMRLPSFLLPKDTVVGLGDAIKKVTYVSGITSKCSGCDKRAAVLNRWLGFSR